MLHQMTSSLFPAGQVHMRPDKNGLFSGFSCNNSCGDSFLNPIFVEERPCDIRLYLRDPWAVTTVGGMAVNGTRWPQVGSDGP